MYHVIKYWIALHVIALGVTPFQAAPPASQLGPQDTMVPENVALVRQTLASIAFAAQQKNEQKILDLMAPALRRANTDEVRRLPEINDTILIKRTVWHNEFDRSLISAVSENASIEMIQIYNTKSGQIWEVFVKHENEHLSAAVLWYFVRVRDKLLLRDSPFFNCPDSFKKFAEDEVELSNPK
jgi:hypothetical protein